MTHNTDTHSTYTTRHTRRRLATLLALAVAGLGLLVFAISSTGGGSHHALQASPALKPAVAAASHDGSAAPPAPAPGAKPGNAIPQQNAGDGDADNNAGPNDGDGAI